MRRHKVGVSISFGIVLVLGFALVLPPAQERAEPLRPGRCPPKHCRLVGGEAVAEHIEPSLLDVRGPVAGRQIRDSSENMVMNVVEQSDGGVSVPPVLVEVGQVVEDACNLSGAGRRPASRPT
jgi:hypothetical protein